MGCATKSNSSDCGLMTMFHILKTAKAHQSGNQLKKTNINEFDLKQTHSKIKCIISETIEKDKEAVQNKEKEKDVKALEKVEEKDTAKTSLEKTDSRDIVKTDKKVLTKKKQSKAKKQKSKAEKNNWKEDLLMIEKEKQTNKTKNQTSETHKPETANEGSPKNIKLQKGDCRTKHAKKAEEEEEETIAQDITIKQNLANLRELNKVSDYSEDEEVKELTNS